MKTSFAKPTTPGNRSGFTLVEVMIVVGIIGLIAAIAVPSYVKSRNVSRQNACINNLRIIDSAKEQWAMEAKQSDGSTVVINDANEYVKGSTTPFCPTGGSYTYRNIGSSPTCSLGVSKGHRFR